MFGEIILGVAVAVILAAGVGFLAMWWAMKNSAEPDPYDKEN